MTQDFFENRKNFREKWAKMTSEEKVAFVDRRMDECTWDNKKIIADIDKRCEAWLKKTPEEKEAIIEKRKAKHAAMHDKFVHWHNRFGDMHDRMHCRGGGMFGCGGFFDHWQDKEECGEAGETK